MASIARILNEVIGSLNASIDLYFIENLGEGKYKCLTTNTYWLTIDSYLNIIEDVTGQIKEYRVVDFEQNKYLTLGPLNSDVAVNSSPRIGSYTINNPYFVPGKLKVATTEMSNSKDGQQKPLIWMFEPLNRTRPAESDTALESTGDVRLFFMNSSEYNNSTNIEKYRLYVDPVSSMVSLFIRKLKKHPRAGKIFLTSVIDHTRFTNDSGDTDSLGNNILPRQASGQEVFITIPIRKSVVCNPRQIPTLDGGAYSDGYSDDFDN